MTKLNTSHPIHVLIAAAGNGTRFGSDTPKQYCKINGKAILRHTIERFLKITDQQNIHVIINPAHENLYSDAISGLLKNKPLEGGESRKESIYKALKVLPNVKSDDIIIIHDAARPFFDLYDVAKMRHALETCKAATLSRKISDTLYDKNSRAYPDRDCFNTIQTPQGFYYGVIFDAHEKFMHDNSFTDDASLVSAHGVTVQFIESSSLNFKITTQEDFRLAEMIMADNRQTRSGIGFDVHAFNDTQASVIRLGGIDIPHNKSLKGHSDADVVLHSITDALLGAVAAGDIGDYFPPSNDDFKNMDSAVFLKKAKDIVLERQGVVVNIDITIMCEAPKIGPYKEKMQSRIAEILDIETGKIGIKATTTEKLGFTGRQEGIATQAIANVSVPA